MFNCGKSSNTKLFNENMQMKGKYFGDLLLLLCVLINILAFVSICNFFCINAKSGTNKLTGFFKL